MDTGSSAPTPLGGLRISRGPSPGIGLTVTGFVLRARHGVSFCRLEIRADQALRVWRAGQEGVRWSGGLPRRERTRAHSERHRSLGSLPYFPCLLGLASSPHLPAVPLPRRLRCLTPVIAALRRRCSPTSAATSSTPPTRATSGECPNPPGQPLPLLAEKLGL